MIAGDDQLRWEGGQAVIRMPVEIDVPNADEIRKMLGDAASDASSVLVIDMSMTTFCDSAGLHCANNQVHARNQSATTRTQLRLVATAALRVIQLVGIDQLIPVYQTLEVR